MLLALLVGNTTVRHAILDGSRVVGRGATTIPPAPAALPSGWIPPGPWEAVLAGSVNPPRLAEIRAAFPAGSARLLVAGEGLPIPIENRYRDPAETGQDRLLGALAAARLRSGRGSVVLDFGTTLSVSIVSPDGAFLGGPILAGIRSLALGLARSTARLPEIQPASPPESLLARSTHDAITAGIFAQVTGGAREVLSLLRSELLFPFEAIATGGDAGMFAPLLPEISLVEPDLALRGLGFAYAEMGR